MLYVIMLNTFTVENKHNMNITAGPERTLQLDIYT